MRSFGPSVYHNEDGSFRASCGSCIFLTPQGTTNMCRYRQRQMQEVLDPRNTPDWCEMRDGMLQDAKDMAAGIEHKVVRWSGRRTDEPRVIFHGIPSEAERQFRLAARDAKRGTVQLMNERFEEVMRHPEKEAAA